MRTPVIGVCAAFEPARWGFWDQPAAILPATYLDKVRAAGGLPVGLVPDPRATQRPGLVLERVDGLLLIGGVDLEPETYGAVRSPRTEATVPERDAFELALARAALARDLPVLGICRGMQILNVAAGGTLHQHLTDAGFAEHRRSPGRLDSATFHEIDVVPCSLAESLSGSGVQVVNSHHHQGVDALGQGAVVSAWSLPDRLPEAIEFPSCQYALGVQWHPEVDHLQHALTAFVAVAARPAREDQPA
ncbi:gamma-glutamyl-gamma-aminobutyrate hydrolase [Amycolatopsis deserti]|uniref:Gamma-glutamyl-gamma-aminobutyrate hydrolase n=1 Tax=Amycolatopsis deserti TaxID=185696 RepID=A0ABQ3IA65_9PSEU|nr:gamma-glutamyl-gamma-aminobutyrate hydrolase family protein [Amycolatopsis deserti]GHE76515.1 gamma-glutamyl-gamma-aminobutyrate hydrolase [Amycolatopsis deserti]